jgi:hypothetical protein
MSDTVAENPTFAITGDVRVLAALATLERPGWYNVGRLLIELERRQGVLDASARHAAWHKRVCAFCDLLHRLDLAVRERDAIGRRPVVLVVPSALRSRLARAGDVSRPAPLRLRPWARVRWERK